MTRRRICAILWTAILHAPLTLPAAEAERQLEILKRKLETERREMSAVNRQENSLLRNLEKIEADLEEKNRQLHVLAVRLQDLEAGLRKSEEEWRRLSGALAQRRQWLRRRLQALYRWHRGGSPGMLLNGEVSAAELMRRRRYLELVVARDQELLRGYLEDAARHDSLKRELTQKREAIERQRAALSEAQEAVRVERERKRELLASVRREKEGRARALRELEQASQTLQKMIEEMSRRGTARRPPAKGGEEGLARGLELPVRGEVVEKFGKSRHPDFAEEIFRKGINIEAMGRQEVRAIESGTVVFADRFSGYGRMIIIDHGQRYHSVYAHLSEILKEVGQEVRRGEPVAVVGDADSSKAARLYFEIRKDGKPVDPLVWLKKR